MVGFFANLAKENISVQDEIAGTAGCTNFLTLEGRAITKF
jgi:hypothetical protein